MGSGSSPCAACKLLRRRCTEDCIFAPYFLPDDPRKFVIAHKVFGASNISKLLQELPVDLRGEAVSSLVYEANARMRDPVHGCYGTISNLQNQVYQLQKDLAVAQAEILRTQMQQEPELPTTHDPSMVDYDPKNARMRDPVHGCYDAISNLQNQVSELQKDLAVAQAEIFCIQMQQEPELPTTHDPSMVDYDPRNLQLSGSNTNDFGDQIPQFFSYTSNNNVIQDPQRESLWT